MSDTDMKSLGISAENEQQFVEIKALSPKQIMITYDIKKVRFKAFKFLRIKCLSL